MALSLKLLALALCIIFGTPPPPLADGIEQVVVCGVEGEVRGYMPMDAAHSVPEQAMEADFTEQQAIIADLAQKKQELMYELASYANMRANTDKGTVSFMFATGQHAGQHHMTNVLYSTTGPGMPPGVCTRNRMGNGPILSPVNEISSKYLSRMSVCPCVYV